MYTVEDINERKLTIMENNGLKDWENYNEALDSVSKNKGLAGWGDLTAAETLGTLDRYGVENWVGYQRSMDEFQMYLDFLQHELRLTNIEDYIDDNNLKVAGSDDLADLEDTLTRYEVQKNNNMNSIMKDTELTPIANVIKELNPNFTDFEVAHWAISFNKNANFYTPETELGLELLYKTKQITANTVFQGQQPSANEYLLVARPIFLALSIHSGHLENEVKKFLNI